MSTLQNHTLAPSPPESPLRVHTPGTLQPHHLSQQAQEAVQALLREGTSGNTLTSYRSALRYWVAWFELRYPQTFALPLPAAVVVQFIVDHAQRHAAQGLVHELPADIDAVLCASGVKGKKGALALNTLLHRVSVLSSLHQERSLPNPVQEFQVRELLARTRRAYARRGALAQKKDALTKDPLQALLATCEPSLQGLRDRALLLFAWATGGRRRSEVAQAEMHFLQRTGKNAFVYELAHSKTNQSGVRRYENFKPVQGVAAQALEAWLDAAQIKEGRIFRRILKGGQIAGPLSPASVREVVLKRCALAGIEGNFSAHSLRSGFVTEAARQSVPLGDVMEMTGHRSVAQAMGYYRAGNGNANRAAQLLRDEEPGAITQ